jgi:hypothetical protein
MKKTLPLLFITFIFLAACKKDDVPVIAVLLSTVSYTLTDSMRLSASTMVNFPNIYNNYFNKTYTRVTDKVKAGYKQEGADVIITFEDTSVANLGSAIAFKIANKNASGIAGNYTALSSDITYKSKQETSSSSAYLSLNWDKAIAGSIQINYDAASKTFSGSISDFKYAFGVYVPYFEAGSPVTPGITEIGFLTAEGSFRKHHIQFQFVKAL